MMITAPKALSAFSRFPFRHYVCNRCLQRTGLISEKPAGLGIRDIQTTAVPEAGEPLRKRLKDLKKHTRHSKRPADIQNPSRGKDPQLDDWELTVGIEIHAELNTAKKLFSSAQTSNNDDPNTHVALFDAAFPGTQPQYQEETLLPAIRAALALNCNIQERCTFDRKHYFYQDQPSGYQITQYYEPLAKDGHIVLHAHDGIAPEDGESVTIGIKQVQIEQDTAKTLHNEIGEHYLDFNRVSHPLIEIITLPHIHHPTTAAACVRKIQSILRSVNATTAGMELGGLRADVNVSVRPTANPGADSNRSYFGMIGLGTRTEIKNLGSLKAVEEAIVAERGRQVAILNAGGVIEGETRGWTVGSKKTSKLRGKEGEVDYRYMPDPDLRPVYLGKDLIEQLRLTLPNQPDLVFEMITKGSKYGLSLKDAKTLLAMNDGDRLDYYLTLVETVRRNLGNDPERLSKVGKTAGNWVIHELGGLVASSEIQWEENPVSVVSLASLLTFLLRRQITGKAAKQLLSTVFHDRSRSVEQIIGEDNLLLKPMSEDEYIALSRRVIQSSPDVAQTVKDTGHQGKLMFLVGQMLKIGDEGRVEPDRAKKVVIQELGLDLS